MGYKTYLNNLVVFVLMFILNNIQEMCATLLYYVINYNYYDLSIIIVIDIYFYKTWLSKTIILTIVNLSKLFSLGWK